MPRRIPDQSRAVHWPIYWFARMQAALADGDFGGAATAHGNLARLGVHVRIAWPDGDATPEAPPPGGPRHA